MDRKFNGKHIVDLRNKNLITNTHEWLRNMGRLSVAEKIESDDNNMVRILAYSDNQEDWAELFAYAKEIKAKILKNILEEGVNYID